MTPVLCPLLCLPFPECVSPAQSRRLPEPGSVSPLGIKEPALTDAVAGTGSPRLLAKRDTLPCLSIFSEVPRRGVTSHDLVSVPSRKPSVLWSEPAAGPWVSVSRHSGFTVIPVSSPIFPGSLRGLGNRVMRFKRKQEPSEPHLLSRGAALPFPPGALPGGLHSPPRSLETAESQSGVQWRVIEMLPH